MRAFRIVPAPPQAVKTPARQPHPARRGYAEAARRHVQVRRGQSAGRIRRDYPGACRHAEAPIHVCCRLTQHAGFARACWTPYMGIHLLRFDDLAAGVVVGIVALPFGDGVCHGQRRQPIRKPAFSPR